MKISTGIAGKWLLLFVINASLIGAAIDSVLGNRIDYWIHDAALVYQARTVWKHTAIVLLDDDVPVQVGRKQALPLFARAAEQALAAGAKGVFLDARVPKEMEGIMPYALCFETNGTVRWSRPGCQATAPNRCGLRNSPAGTAPLKMKGSVFPYFKIAPYLTDSNSLPDFLLYGFEAEAFIPPEGLVASDRLPGKNSPISRWLDLGTDHAIVMLAKFVDAGKVLRSLQEDVNESCDREVACRRIRLTYPYYNTRISEQQPIIPVSRLASCDDRLAGRAASLLKDRAVILQLTTPSETTDMLITPMTSAWLGPHSLTPGAQFLADAVETLLNGDHPREPHRFVKLTVFLLAALLSVYAGAYLKQGWLWLVGFALVSVLSALCFFSPQVQLWPVTAATITFVAGALQIIGVHLLIGFREGKLITQYMPEQIHYLLLSLKGSETFQSRRHQAIVLMSDITGYTSITGILKEPAHVLELMNDYLGETSFVLQKQYEGWLETYLGDMVCYYWPFNNETRDTAFRNALLGTVELAQLQKRFFSEVVARYRNRFDVTRLEQVSRIVDAGIGLSSGTVVMGDLGPKRGVRKFGILGDPMNLTARIESLTRHFNTEIIVTADFFATAKALGFPVRRLGRFCVKGREQPELLYALGTADDPRFQRHNLEAWDNWLTCEEQGGVNRADCPDIFAKDKRSFAHWEARGLLRQGIWHLHEK